MSHAAHANEIVKRYAMYSAAAGLIAVPIADMVAVTALELKMISEISKLYGTPFSEDRGKSIVAALTGGLGASNLAYGAGGKMLAAVPFIGPTLALCSGPLFGYAATYAVGRVFVQHYESGGTLLDFDAGKMKHAVHAEFEAAKGRADAPATA
jgi:uncharacterized protein (DUF697 family)